MTREAAETAASPAGNAGAERDLGLVVRSNLRWSALNQVSARMLSFASGIALARLLTPRQFGIFAVALVAIEALQSLNDLGLLTGLVRHQGDVRHVARTGVTLAWISSSVLFLIALAAAGPFAATFHAPDATGVVRLLMLAILIDGVSIVPAALLTRAMRQDLRTLADIAGTVVSIVVALGMALAGAGAWSLAGGRLAGNAVSALIIIRVAPVRLLPGWNRAHARELLVFGVPMAGATVILYALLNADFVVVGNYLGPVALGIYLLATNVAGWPLTIVSAAARRVSLAGFSRLTDQPAALARGFATSLALLLAAVLPLYLLLALMASSLVAVVYGGKWSQAATVLPALAVLGAVRGAVYLADDLLAATGRSKTTMVLHGIWLILLVPAVLIGVRVDGLVGAAVAQAGVALLVLTPYAVALRPAGIHLADLGVNLRRVALALVAASIAALLLLQVVGDNFARLGLVGSAALAVYSATLATSPRMRRLVRR